MISVKSLFLFSYHPQYLGVEEVPQPRIVLSTSLNGGIDSIFYQIISPEFALIISALTTHTTE